MGFLTSHWLYITAAFVAFYLAVTIGEHLVKKKIAKKEDGEKLDRNRTSCKY